MRLICPNCDAQYEVDDAVIPSGGRDVQCSNCGHTWFQPAAGEELPEPEAPDWDTPVPPELAGAPDDTPTPPDEVSDAEADPMVDEIAEADPMVDEIDTGDEEEVSYAPEAAPSPRRQVLDDTLAEVLREEAERERQAREADARGEVFQSQPDLGLDETAPAPGSQRPANPQEHVARLRGVEPEDKSASGSRRDLLPDIEEINYSLRAESDRKSKQARADSSDEAARTGGGFGLGFSLVILLAVILVCLYVFAPLIADAVPQTQPILVQYVDLADRFRLGLESLIGDLVKQISNLTAE